MKKIVITLFLLFSFTIVNAGGPIPKGCPLEGYEKNNYCPSYYTISKVKSDIKYLKENQIGNGLLLDEGKYYILGNNYFYTNNGLKKIKELFFIQEGWLKIGKIKKNDVIIIDNFIAGYEK